jgi:hypothetical protein
MELLTLYARKAPTTDSVAIQYGLKGKKDTVLYRDRECTKPAARWPWHYSNCPRRGQRTVMFNCWRWKLEWLEGTTAVSK